MRLVILLFSVVMVFACSSSDEGGTVQNGGGSGGTGTGGTSGSGALGGFGGSGGGGVPCTSDPDCPNGYCSVAQVCAPTGGCAANGDCTAPQVCGQGSRTCLDPGTCADPSDCGQGETCDNGSCVLGGECGRYEHTRVVPNVMILLDRSCSMVNDAGGDTRWNVAKAAIGTVTTAFDAEIRFGLATYSACLAGGCSAGSIVVPVAGNNASAINGYLADKLDQGSNDGQNQVSGGVEYLCASGDPETSTGKSLNALVGEASLQDTTRPNAVLLLTDGEESGSCVDNGVDGPTGAGNLLAQDPSVKTFVVGLGVNAASVNAIAQAGGTGQLISANNQSELEGALASIAGQIATCDIVLDTAPPDPNKLDVFFNEQTPGIVRDGTDGWSYDPNTNTVHFHGAACDRIKNQEVTSIIVSYGCAGVIPQ